MNLRPSPAVILPLLGTLAAVASATRKVELAPPRSNPPPAIQTPAITPAVKPGDSAAIAKAKADSARYPYTAADIHFVSGMIVHHSQAILIAGWAPTHGANASLRTLSERIINGQQDEILTMQQWLRDRLQPVPESGSGTGTMQMVMIGVEHEMLMPGMLTDAQLARLDSAKGADFDRLFLTFMIQHHRGALTMVNELLSTQGALQDQTVFKLASDINADQSTEVERMQRMLSTIISASPSR